MVAKILLCINNDIDRTGLSTILSKGIIGSVTFNINKSQIIKKINSTITNIIILEVQDFDEITTNIINEISKNHPQVDLFLLLNKFSENYNTEIIKKKSLKYILDTFSNDQIIEIISKVLNQTNEKLSLNNKKSKISKTIYEILSKRELEIALLLIKGYKVNEIGVIKRLTSQTVSAYKKRIFEKTRIENIIQLSELFNKYYL